MRSRTRSAAKSIPGRVALALLLVPGAALANQITVNTLLDTDVADGLCSLREAIEAANSDAPYHGCTAGSGDDEIDFSVTGTIALNSNLQEISSSLTIKGPGRDQLTVDGALQHSVFRLDAPGAGLLRVRSLTITRALAVSGAAVWLALDDDATLSDVLISDCEASFGGALYASSSGHVMVLDSEMSGNRGDLGGGALYVNGSAELFVQDSTIADNFAGPDDGTTDADGGGILVVVTPFEIRRSTISGNGARGNGGGMFVNATGLLRSTTVVENFGDSDGDGNSGGGLRVDVVGDVEFANSIVAGNTDGSAAGGLEPDISLNSGSVTSLSYNWIGDNSSVGSAFPAPSTPGTPNINADYVGTPAAPIDPVLSALVDNGGPTRTHRPLVASPVIDQGDCPSAGQDQRGYGDATSGRRTVDDPAIGNLGDGCDIGAVERGAVPLAGLPFDDGFESGDTSAWSVAVP